MKSIFENKLTMGLMAATLALLVFNSYQLSTLQVTPVKVLGSAQAFEMPTGVPELYGPELEVSFDAVSPQNPQLADLTIRRMAQLDREIELQGADLERYINILYVKENGISCEYCCGARSIIFENGKAACGCAHSFAMRGLAKYLITEHGDEYTDDEILAEVGKWKALFFPGQIAAKAQILKEQGVEPDMISLTSNKYRGIEKGAAGGGMVGGC